MAKYRKKPVVIEARQLVNGKWRKLEKWCSGSITRDGLAFYGIVIKTLEGNMTAVLGDWIIKGVQGEFYPCKSDIFEQTYEPV